MNRTSSRRTILLSAALATMGLSMHAQATSLFWDTNGSAAGAGNPASGTWDTTVPNWNTDPAGADQGVISAYPADGSTTDVIFSAGSDAVSGHTVTINGNVAANSISSLFGTQTFAGANFVTGQAPTDTLTLGAGGWTVTKGSVQNGAPKIGASLNLVIGAPQTWLMNGIPSFFTDSAVTQFNNPLTLTRLLTAGNSNGNFSFTNSASTGNANITINGTSNAVTILVGANSIYDTNGVMISGPLGLGTIKINQGRVESAATTPNTGTFTIGNAMEVTGTTAAFGGQNQVGPLIFTGAVTLDAGSGKTITLDGTGSTKPQSLTFNAPTNLLTNGTFSAAAFDTSTFAGPITDDFATTNVGKNLTKTGSGTIILTGTNTFHGALSVLNGTVALQSADLSNNVANASAINVVSPGNLDVTGLASGLTVGNQTLSGTGHIIGNLTLAGDGTFSFDNSGALNVSGNLGLTDGGTTNVVLPTLASLTAGTYAMINYNGSKTGTGTFAVSVPPNTRANPTVDATPSNVVNLVINGNAADLVWKGDGAANAWNVNQTPNWTNNGNPDNFFNLDRVTFDDSSPNTTVNVTDPVYIGGMTVNGAQSFTFQGNGTITGTGSLVVNTSGEVTMSTSNSYTGGTTVQQGTLFINNSDALPSGSGINFSGGTIALAQNLSHAIKAFPLTVGGTFDLANNKLIDDFVSTDPISTVTSAIQSGYNGGAWTGQGITSSTAAAIAADTNNPHKTGIGFAEASALPNLTTFGGLATDSTMVLIGYTYFGDSNLDGTVNALDFNAVASNFGAGGKSWVNGDFNYDGTVDTNDFTALSQNFGLSLGAAPALGTLVPEPASLGLLGIAALGLTRRRKRA